MTREGFANSLETAHDLEAAGLERRPLPRLVDSGRAAILTALRFLPTMRPEHGFSQGKRGVAAGASVRAGRTRDMVDFPRCSNHRAGNGTMKQRILERARSAVEAFLHQQCADATLSMLSVNSEVDGYGDEFLLIHLA